MIKLSTILNNEVNNLNYIIEHIQYTKTTRKKIQIKVYYCVIVIRFSSTFSHFIHHMLCNVCCLVHQILIRHEFVIPSVPNTYIIRTAVVRFI